MEAPILLLLFLLLAIAYSTVGHGGASGYLAVMALFAIEPHIMRPSALIMNLCVSSIAFILFFRGSHFKPKLFFSLVMASFPMSFIGGGIELPDVSFKTVLGVLLVFASIRLFIVKKSIKTREPSVITAILLGALIGLLSGLIGIGGGILLSPVILFLGWANAKETAAVSAPFIFVNSAGALSGIAMSNHFHIHPDIYWWIGIVCIGALLGSWIGSKRLNMSGIKIALGGVLLVAGIKMLFIQ